MALRVLNTWGLKRTEDIGEIVFNLVDSGKLRKTAEDSRKDFSGGYDFADAFAVPFLPTTRTESVRRQPRPSRGGPDSAKRKPHPGDTLPGL